MYSAWELGLSKQVKPSEIYHRPFIRPRRINDQPVKVEMEAVHDHFLSYA